MLLKRLDVSLDPADTSLLKPAWSRDSTWLVQPRIKDQMLLTLRENEIITYLNKGMTNREIADALFVSEATINKHLYDMFQKLNTKNRMELIGIARSMDILST